jgi:hypothetical protein
LSIRRRRNARNGNRRRASSAAREGHEVSKAYRHAHDCDGNFLVYARDALRRAPANGYASLIEIAEQQAAANARFFDLAASLIGAERN